jgi:Mrp family chromosome partitioning ATPase
MAGLASDCMRGLIDQWSVTFDWVVIDAPPVMLLPDAAVLSKLVGGVIFVIGAGSTPCRMVERAIDELGRDCIIGMVLNRMDEQAIPAMGYYSGYYGSHDESRED